MAPSVDKQNPMKMLPNEEKPMDICTNMSENADYPRDYAHNEYYQEAAAQPHHHHTFDYYSSDELSSPSPSPPHDSFEQMHHPHVACYSCSPTFTKSMVKSNHHQQKQQQQQEDTWYDALMQGILQGHIPINGGVDAIRQTALMLTVRRSDYEMMERLLSFGASADVLDATGKTALHLAAQLGDVRAAKILLNRGAKPDELTPRGFNVAVLAVQSGCTQFLEMLISNRLCDVNELIEDLDLNKTYSLLHSAIECNNLMMVHLLLQHYANANQRNSYGYSCLHIACRVGNIEIVELLLKNGASVHEKSSGNSSALTLAVQSNNRHILELLLHYGANLNEQGQSGATALHDAIRNGDLELIRTLLDLGARVDAPNKFGQTPLYYAIVEKNWQALNLLVEYGADLSNRDSLGKTALHTAIETGRREVYSTLIKRDSSIVNAEDNNQQTPLHYAVRQGCRDTVGLLLRSGADVNARDLAQQTPLHLAVMFDKLPLFSLLMSKQVDINAQDLHGQTPLYIAVIKEQAKAITNGYSFTFFYELIKNGARVRTKIFKTGETPLLMAVKNKCPTFVKDLLCRGSDVEATDCVDKKTPLQLAVDNNDLECIEYLLTYGADVAKLLTTSPKISEAAVQTITRHFIRKLVAGMTVDKRYPKVAERDEEFARQCEEEVKEMKLVKINDEQTYYDFLRSNRRGLVKIANSNDVSFVISEDTRTNFPAFADMLEQNYHIAMRYKSILNAAGERLSHLIPLPDVPVTRILDFLNDDDMSNVLQA